MPIRRYLLPVVGRSAVGWDRFRRRTRLRLGLTTPPILLPYRGIATNGRVGFEGRVIEDEGVVGAPPSASRWTNLWRTYRRYQTEKVHEAHVRWTLGAHAGSARTDREGFFRVETVIDESHLASPWTAAALRLEHAPGYRFEEREAQAKIRVVSVKANFGIISDIDDTIVETGARRLIQHWRTVALNSAEGRIAFPGIACLYQAFAAGEDGPETNPVFYISSSPWNLHDLFEEFMRLCDIPHGPMFLKDFGLNKTQWLTGSHATHKLGAADRILAAYPHLNFVLFGDTGQSDATIYAELVARHPGRIHSVHLRDVTPKGFKPRVRRAIAAMEEAGIPVTSSPTLREAAEIAERDGLVAAGTVDKMKAAVARDRRNLESWAGPMPFRDTATHGPDQDGAGRV
ncbi:MAG: phosphatase domain-containing protein [Aurantimonas endophytica]|uniref:App1 family protein n=1 Tax=Aurantimonas endophytica TaxID=1522175 RepID=UPI0030036D82